VRSAGLKIITVSVTAILVACPLNSNTPYVPFAFVIVIVLSSFLENTSMRSASDYSNSFDEHMNILSDTCDGQIGTVFVLS